MDELLFKGLGMIRLKHEEYGQYLTASEDEVSVNLSSPDRDGWNQKNTELRLEWLKEPNDLVGQVRLWSIYNKVLTLNGDYYKYRESKFFEKTETNRSTSMSQRTWVDGAVTNTAEWKFKFRGKKNGNLIANIFNYSEKQGRSLALLATPFPNTEKEPSLQFTYYLRSSILKTWLNSDCNWKVEVVVVPWLVPKLNSGIQDDCKNIEDESSDPNIETELKSNNDPQDDDDESVPNIERELKFPDREGQSICDQSFISKLSGCQIKHFSIYIASDMAGLHATDAGCSNCTAGGNINASGTQIVGDVKFST